MTFRAVPDAQPIPSKVARVAYIDAVAPSRSLLYHGIIARLPALGSVMLDWKGAWSPEPRAVGVWIGGASKLEFSAYMPDREDRIQIADGLKPYVDLPWRWVGVPLLLAALGLKVAYSAAFGPDSCRVRRLWLRLMWRFRPQEMARRVLAWEEKKRAEAEEYAAIMARCAATEAAREAKREAAFEAEVERRLAERLAAAGA